MTISNCKYIHFLINRQSSHNWQLSTDGVIDRVIVLLVVEKLIGRERVWGLGTIHALNQGTAWKLPLLYAWLMGKLLCTFQVP